MYPTFLYLYVIVNIFFVFFSSHFFYCIPMMALSCFKGFLISYVYIIFSALSQLFFFFHWSFVCFMERNFDSL